MKVDQNPRLAQGIERFNKERDALMKWVGGITPFRFAISCNVIIEPDYRSITIYFTVIEDDGEKGRLKRLHVAYNEPYSVFVGDTELGSLKSAVEYLTLSCQAIGIELPPFEYED